MKTTTRGGRKVALGLTGTLAGLVIAGSFGAATFANGVNPDLNHPEYWEGVLEERGYTEVACEKFEPVDTPWVSPSAYLLVIVKAGTESTEIPNVGAGQQITVGKEISHVIACVGTRPPTTQPPETQPPETQPPETQPPASQPPASQPPQKQPPQKQPEVKAPPAAKPAPMAPRAGSPATPRGPVVQTDEPVSAAVQWGAAAALGSIVLGGTAVAVGRRLSR